MPKKNPRITQKQIGEHLGISQTAVALVLGDNAKKNSRHVSPELRKKILRAAEEMGYRPHRHAQLLKGKLSGVIGLIGNISSTWAQAESLHQISFALEREGMMIYSQNLFWNANSLPQLFHQLQDARVEGLILAGVNDLPPLLRKEILQSGIPVIGVFGDPGRGIPAFLSDHGNGVEQLVEHLLGVGHKNFLVECVKMGGPAPAMRLAKIASMRPKLEKMGIKFELFEHQPHAPHQQYLDYGEILGKSLRNREKGLPDAVLCHNDLTAAAAQMALAGKRGSALHLSMTGYDNDPIGRFLMRPLTTVGQRFADIANEAVEVLLGLIRKGKALETLPEQTLYPCDLIIRSSSQPASLAPPSSASTTQVP